MSNTENFTSWRREQTLIFLDKSTTGTSPSWVRIKMSTLLEIAVNPVTEEYAFIGYKDDITLLDRYKISLSQENQAVEGDACFDYLWGLFYSLPSGSEVQTDCLIVFPKAGTTDGSFQAWKFRATLVLNTFNGVDKKITYDIQAAGDVERGTVTVADGTPTFVAATGD
ncbi:MAG TPA: hypothetical protein H9669_10305 [Firmicutes bacterium]|nr:hypothetical protein [Bacillota bacterium]